MQVLILHVLSIYLVLVVSQELSDCALRRSANSSHASYVQGQNAECMYQSNLEKFYFRITWVHPDYHNVSTYHISIVYDQVAEKCFRIPKNIKQFEFNTTVGFLKGKSINYTVTAEPVPHVGDGKAITKHSDICPLKPVLKPLPHVEKKLGSNFTFHCRFEQNPVPEVSINWMFSKDSVTCKHRHLIKPDLHFQFSNDRRLLKIINAEKAHSGCYILTAENAAGEAKEQRGYLQLVSSPLHADTGNILILGVVVGILLTSFILVISCILYVRYNRRRNHQLTAYPDDMMPVKTVYISHCSGNRTDEDSMVKFASVINTFNLEVIIDLCQQRQINDEGISHWISKNMKSADKVVVVLSPLYISLLGSYDSENTSQDPNLRKICLEYSIIENMLFKNSQRSKNLLLVSKGVKPNEFPLILESKFNFNYPSRLNIKNEGDLDDDFRRIIGVLLEKEPFQLAVDKELSTYHRL